MLRVDRACEALKFIRDNILAARVFQLLTVDFTDSFQYGLHEWLLLLLRFKCLDKQLKSQLVEPLNL